jgi:hypothetical protein
MIDEQICLTNYTIKLSAHSLQPVHMIRFLLAQRTAGAHHLKCPLSLQCFLHFLPMASTMAGLLPISDLY